MKNEHDRCESQELLVAGGQILSHATGWSRGRTLHACACVSRKRKSHSPALLTDLLVLDIASSAMAADQEAEFPLGPWTDLNRDFPAQSWK